MVSVAVAPKITPFQVDPTLRLGERLTLTCAVSKGDPPLTIGWMVNGHVVTSAGGEIKTMLINAFTSILAIDSLQMSHSGNYTCLVRNAAGQVSQSQLVVIQGRQRPMSLGLHWHRNVST
jgi:Immunoglobulin domain